MHCDHERVPAVRVFHVDDSLPFRVLVREMLREFGDLEVVGEAGTPAEARERLAAAHADVVLVDLLEPGDEGSLLEELRAAAPQAGFLLYTGMPLENVPEGTRHVHKSVPFEELHRAIREAAAGA